MRLWTEIRSRVLAEGLSRRQPQPRPKRKLERFLPIIHEILKQDPRAPRKQRHTAKRIYDRLRAEHSYDGGYTIVKDAVRAWRNRQAEVYMPLVHPPGEARARLDAHDFRKVPDILEAAAKLQGHNARLIRLIERSESRLLRAIRQVARLKYEVSDA